MSHDVNSAPPRPGLSLAMKIALAGLMVFLSTGAAVATGIEKQAREITDELKNSRISSKAVAALTPTEQGKPQTLLLVGDDHRYSEGGKSRADTMILLRLDPNANSTTMLSLPRDLRTSALSGRKLNEAYSGGAEELIPTLSTLLSTPTEPFPIHHFVSVRFSAFAQAVNFFGCFYADIDQTYFNPPNTGWAEIDVKSGYQRICGEDSLNYVRFRHLDSDYVREARQANYLAEARTQIGASKILGQSTALVTALKRFIKTDIQQAEGLLRVVNLAAGVADKPVKKVTLDISERPGSDPTTTPEALEKAVKEFLHPRVVRGAEFRKEKASKKSSGSSSKSSGGSSASAKARRLKAKQRPRTLINGQAAGAAAVRPIAEQLKDTPSLPVYYPKFLVGRGTTYETPDTRAYDISNRAGSFIYPAYRIVAHHNKIAGSYYGVQGVRWDNPPILQLADDEIRLAGRTFKVQYDGSRIRRLIWQINGSTYWINNTLRSELSNQEMYWLAKSLTKVRR